MLVCLLGLFLSTFCDKILAVVGDTVMTDSFFRQEARVALVWHQGVEVAQKPFVPPQRQLLKRYVFGILLVLTQQSTHTDISEEALLQRLEAFVARFADQAAYLAFCQRFGLDQTALLGVLRRMLLSEALVRQHLQLVASPVASGELPTPNALQLLGHAELDSWLQQLRHLQTVHVQDDELR